MSKNDRLITTMEAAEMLGVTDIAIRQRIYRGTLTAQKPKGSRQWWVWCSAIERIKQEKNRIENPARPR